MNPTELRLARAKAIRDYRMATGRDIYQSDEGFVAAIESADAALGVVSVRVDAEDAAEPMSWPEWLKEQQIALEEPDAS